MVLALMAGGSMFAATRFSVGVSLGGVTPAYAAPACNGYVAPVYNGYNQPRYDARFDGGREFREQRDFGRDRGHDRDDRGRGRVEYRGHSNDYRR
jgi:hypothetical protein